MATSVFEMTYDELYDWGNSIKPAAQLAWEGKGEFVPGEHCRWCRIKGKCKARTEQLTVLVEQNLWAKAQQMSPVDIAALLPRLDEIVTWATDIKEHALEQAVKHGVRYPGWKLVEGRSNRTYSDRAAVLQTLIERKFKPEEVCKPAELLGITDMEKKLGKKTFAEVLGDLITKPAGKPVLAPAADKREELRSSVAADADFDAVA